MKTKNKGVNLFKDKKYPKIIITDSVLSVKQGDKNNVFDVVLSNNKCSNINNVIFKKHE